MTVASEITRLNTAKSCLKASIEAKGITVGSNLSLSCYYKCVDAIEGAGKMVDVLVIGGGGSGKGVNGTRQQGGGGGAGGVIFAERYGVETSTSITVGNGGPINYWDVGAPNGCSSCFGDLVALGGGGGNCGTNNGKSGGSGGGAGGGNSGSCRTYSGGAGTAGTFFPQGNAGGGGVVYSSGGFAGGGGGAGGPGCGTAGGPGITSDISGTSYTYAKGGNGSCTDYSNVNATTYGSGGAGTAYGNKPGGSGYQGIVIVRYPTNGDYGFTSATGGNSCVTCNGYKIHTFTSNGTFTVVS